MSSHTKLTDDNIMNKLEYYLNKLYTNTSQEIIPEIWYPPAGFNRGKISEEFFKAEYECTFLPSDET